MTSDLLHLYPRDQPHDQQSNKSFSDLLFQGGLHVRSLSFRKPFSRTKRFLQNFWNLADLLSYVFLIAGLAERELGNDQKFNMPRRLYSFSLVLMYLRCLKVFIIHKTIGTTLSIIKEMVLIFIVFVTDNYALFIIMKKENKKDILDVLFYMPSICLCFCFVLFFLR